MTNQNNTVLYTGVTNNQERRNTEHKEKCGSKFTSKYNVDKLVYFETFFDVSEAIQREKQIKGGSRQKKINLISKSNSDWRDLTNEI